MGQAGASTVRQVGRQENLKSHDEARAALQ